MKTRLFLIVMIPVVTVLSIRTVRAGVDLSSPKATAKSFYAAVADSDAAALRDCLLATTDDQKKMGGAFVDLIVAGKKLSDAAKEKFGAAGDKLGAGVVTHEDAALIDKADEKDNGDEATLQIPENPRPLRFHKTESGWKLVVDQPTDPAGKAGEQVKLLSDLAAAMNETADEISGGKFPVATDAEAAIQQRFSEVMAQRYKPATQPTTRP